MDLQTIMANRDKVQAMPPKEAQDFLSLAFDNFVAGRLGNLQVTDMAAVKQKWINTFLGKPSLPLPSDFAQPSEKESGVALPPVGLGAYAKTALHLVNPRTTLASSGVLGDQRSSVSDSIPFLAVLVLVGLALYLLVRICRRRWRIARDREWFSVLNERLAHTKLEYVLRSLAWAAIMAGVSYVVHPRLSSSIQYRLRLGMPWLPDVCWFALPFGIAMTYLTRRFRQVLREEYENQRKPNGQ